MPASVLRLLARSEGPLRVRRYCSSCPFLPLLVDKAPASPFHFPSQPPPHSPPRPTELLLCLSCQEYRSFLCHPLALHTLFLGQFWPRLCLCYHFHTKGFQSCSDSCRPPALCPLSCQVAPPQHWKPGLSLGRPFHGFHTQLVPGPWIRLLNPRSLISCLIFKDFFVSFLDYYISLFFIFNFLFV